MKKSLNTLSNFYGYMARLIAPDEFNYIVSNLGQPGNVKLSYTPLSVFDFGHFSRDLRQALPNYGFGSQPTLVTVLELENGEEGQRIPISELYRLSFNSQRDFVGVIQDVDGRIYRVDESPDSRIAHLEFVAARWNVESPHLPSVILTPENLTVRKRKNRIPKLDDLVSWAGKEGVTEDTGIYDSHRDYQKFLGDWEKKAFVMIPISVRR